MPLLTGCATSSSTRTASVSPGTQQEAQQLLADDWRLYENAEYHQAISSILHLLLRYPATNASVEARYLLGLCYESVEGYKDAMNLFRDYLAIAPDGEYAQPAKEHIQELVASYETRYPSEARLKQELATIDTKILDDPNSVVLRIQRANRTWSLGNYESAGRQYMEVIQRDPGFKNTQTFNERMELQSDGSFVIITPNVQADRDIAREPIAIRNLNAFKSGRDRRSQRRRFYVVSGQVHNRSDETHYGVEVYTTIFGFGNVVWDTGTYNVGRLYPGETRAFSFRFGDIHNIDAVHHHESKVTYQP